MLILVIAISNPILFDTDQTIRYLFMYTSPIQKRNKIEEKDLGLKHVYGKNIEN